MKKSIVTVLGVSVFGVGLYASQALASPVSCDAYTTSWYNQGLQKGCTFSGTAYDYSWGYAYGTSLSGEIEVGTKALMSDLDSTYMIPNGYYAFTKVMGYLANGGVIAGCSATDTSTAAGQSAVDSDGGCENAGRHRIYLRLDPI